jgi:hypothetical protein
MIARCIIVVLLRPIRLGDHMATVRVLYRFILISDFVPIDDRAIDQLLAVKFQSER